VKGNIGHLEGASGLAGVVKCILMLEKGVVPPNANFEKLNPNIDADFLCVQVGADSVSELFEEILTLPC
jgi:acyl transferase domain-containing protein